MRSVKQDGPADEGLPSFAQPAVREIWVPAAEAALELETPRQFMEWLHRFVRPVLRYQIVVCGTGLFSQTTVAADRLLLRGFPHDALEALRDAGGVICLPRGHRMRAQALRPLDGAQLYAQSTRHRAQPARNALGAMAVLDGAGTSRRFGSYFLFGRLEAQPGCRENYVAAILGPTMHEALGRALEGAQALRAPLVSEATLSRRETELLNWLIEGKTTPQIAHATCRSAYTVANQLRTIRRKLGAANRAQATARALSLGLVQARDRPAPTRLIAAQSVANYDARGPDAFRCA